MKLRREKAGILASIPMWVCIYGPYIHVHSSLFKLILEVLTQYRHDKHLIG